MTETTMAEFSFRPHAAWVDGEASSDDRLDIFEDRDPSTDAPLLELQVADRSLVDAAVASASAAFKQRWRGVLPAERGRIARQIAHELLTHRDELALLESLDAGVPLSMARADVDVAARYFEFYAGMADKYAGEVIPLGESFLDYTLREPWGVCGIIVPFNFPLQQISRSLSVALCAGNTVVLKSSERSPLVATAMARICHDAGLPHGVFNVVHGMSATGEALIDSPEVAHVTFTGSRVVGALIMARCAKRVVPVTMELGGKSAQIVLDERLIDQSCLAIASVMFRTAGQACSAGSRILVREDLKQRVVQRLTDLASSLRVGPATLADTEVGPLISSAQQARVLAAVETARTEGAQLKTGGAPGADDATRQGHFVLPTVLDDIAPSARLNVDELFGPVLGITGVKDAEEALRLANESPYGLVAGVWTRDINEALSLARDLEVGQVFVNNYGAGGGVELPFGGRKDSGFGREKGLEALSGYTQVKNVCVKIG